VGVAATALLGTFSLVYAIASILWCVTFVEWWKHQELDLAVRWGVRGVSAVHEKRKDFHYEKKIHDPITGEEIEFFPAKKRLARQALQIPFALLSALMLGTMIATCFSIEIFISELYNGPGKSVLVRLSLFYPQSH
jgi:anoctamin-10